MANEIIVVTASPGQLIDRTVVNYMKQGFKLHGSPFQLRGGPAQIMVAGIGPVEDIGEYQLVIEDESRTWASEMAWYATHGWIAYGDAFHINGVGHQAMTSGKIITDEVTGPVVERFGWWNYENILPAQDVPADEWTTLMNDGLGPGTNTLFKPSDLGSILDPLTGHILLDSLKVGDEIYIRHQINVTPSTGYAECSFGHRFGSGGMQTRVPTGQKIILDGGAGVDTDFFLLDAHFFIRDEDERISGMYPQVFMSSPATIDYRGCYISVNRR